MGDSPAETATWHSDDRLLEHFEEHGEEVGATTVEQYDASARWTIRVGKRFTYVDRKTEEPRTGYYALASNRFTSLDSDEQRILSHFAPSARETYIRGLLDSDHSR